MPSVLFIKSYFSIQEVEKYGLTTIFVPDEHVESALTIKNLVLTFVTHIDIHFENKSD